jgi:hypothetical protein
VANIKTIMMKRFLEAFDVQRPLFYGELYGVQQHIHIQAIWCCTARRIGHGCHCL